MQMTMQMSTSGVSGKTVQRKPSEHIQSWLKKKKKREKKTSILNYKVSMVAKGIYD